METQKLCNVDIIITGNEIVFGRLVDTNSSWIAKQVTEHGGRVRRVTCVGDVVEDIEKVVREALAQEHDLIIITGGLGPSSDDLTVKSIARAVDRKVVLSKEALDMLLTKCKEFSRELTSRMRKMAYVVECSQALENPVGYAPGMSLKAGKTVVLALPGVPEEMKATFELSVLSLIDKITRKRLVAKSFHARIGWVDFLEIRRQIVKEFPKVHFKTYSSAPAHSKYVMPSGGIKLDIFVEGEDIDACEATLRSVTEELRVILEEKGGTLVQDET